MGDAARLVLNLCGVTNKSNNPVEDAFNRPEYGNTYLILSTSKAFGLIAESADREAQKIARQCKEAVDDFYK